MNEVQVIKLSSGEEIVGRVTSITDGFITVSHPVMLQVATDADGNPRIDPATQRPSLGFVPAFPMADGVEIQLNRNLIIYNTNAQKGIADAHNNQFGFGGGVMLAKTMPQTHVTPDEMRSGGPPLRLV